MDGSNEDGSNEDGSPRNGSRPARPGAGAVLVATVLLVTSCGSAAPGVPTASTPASPAMTTTAPPSGGGSSRGAGSARDAVTGYLSAVSGHDAAAAYGYLAPEYPQDLVGTFDSFQGWVANVVSLRPGPMPPEVDSSGSQGQYPLYRDLVEFGVTYDVAFRTESALEASGAQTRFLVVGRSRAEGSWRVLSIGTGP